MTRTHDERRRHARIPVRLVVHFTRGDSSYRLASENLSLGGIFLRGADEVCAEGDVLALDVVVPSETGIEEQHRIHGRVVQRVAGSGVGVAFDWDADDVKVRQSLEAFIDRAGMLNSGAIHEEYVGLATDAEEEV